MAGAVALFFADRENRRVLRSLAQRGVRVASLPRPRKAKLVGRTFAFTGRLERFTRAEAREAVEFLGGRVTSGVTGTTVYLVAGDAPGSKLAAARMRGVRVIDEAAFARLVRP
jgi:DNA ligase (NAD+)